MANSQIIYRPEQWESLFRFFDDMPLEKPVEVRWGAVKRSNDQNDYYWEVVTPMVADFLTEKYSFPYTKDTAHELLKSEFLPTHKDPVTGRVFYGSTTKLRRSGDDDDCWPTYIKKIQKWAGLGGLYIPDPNEPPRD